MVRRKIVSSEKLVVRSEKRGGIRHNPGIKAESAATCEHDWELCSPAVVEGCLMLQCAKCGAMASADPSKEKGASGGLHKQRRRMSKNNANGVSANRKTSTRHKTMEVLVLAQYPDQGMSQVLGTVLLPSTMTQKQFVELFEDWRSLVGEYPDDDDPDYEEKCEWCEPDTDGEFIDWLIETHGFKRGSAFNVLDVVFD
jgi:hypothetical protein